ncbi:MAG: hypothetical protein OIN86_06840 [Candidatus Methanoperedens sp.]|nr:hypothetical protein [Candidatus Methanoperedens sp.]
MGKGCRIRGYDLCGAPLVGLFLCALAEMYYSRPQAFKHSRRANLQVGRTAFEKGRAGGVVLSTALITHHIKRLIQGRLLMSNRKKLSGRLKY